MRVWIFGPSEQCHSNPQLSSSSTATLSLPMPLQRHSTGSLATAEKSPRKGILKRPQTFNMGIHCPLMVLPRNPTESPATEQNHLKPLSDDRKEKKEQRGKTEEEDKMTQRVEFSDKNAVFGDTTTDTEAGADALNIRKHLSASRKNTTAIVSPVVRSNGGQRPNDSMGDDVRSGRALSEESSEDSKSGGVSHIVGKWWFGKTTKFVVHCDRRGCSAGHSSREGTPTADGQSQQKSTDDAYLTPTQRKQREINALKKELRRSQVLCRDKERHLSQLKEKLDEIERLMASSSSTQMVQCARLKQRLAELENEFTGEREALIDRHEHRIRQMNQEMTDLRTEIARKNNEIDQLIVNHVERRDRAVQVNFSDFEQLHQKHRESHSSAPFSPSLVPATALGWAPPDSERTVEYSENVPFGGEEKRANRPMVQSQMPLLGASKSAPVSPSRGPPDVHQHTDPQLLATLDAYRSETVVWRTRTAQLELILQDLLLREGVTARGVTMAKVPIPAEAETAKGHQLQPTNEANESFNRQQMHSSSMDTIAEATPQQTTAPTTIASVPVGECQRKECVERWNRCDAEQQRMMERANRLEKELSDLRARNRETKDKLAKLNTQLNNLNAEHARLVELAESRLCEIKAIQMALNGTQVERDKLEQALAYIERRCHAMEHIGLDQEVPKELDELQIRVRALQVAFTEDKANMGDQLKDLEQMLNMKTELVAALTGQLENAAKSVRSEDERHQWERDAFSGRIEELSRTAERVPILESELERARGEKSICELRLRRLEEEAGERMERVLAEAMRSSKMNEKYWLEREQKGVTDERMGWQLERLELAHRLRSAIEHTSVLNARLNCPRRDAQCDVRPRTNNKYVICRPNNHDKEVEADLKDLKTERMKEALRTLEAERRWMRSEMDKMERRIADRIGERDFRRPQHKKRTTLLPDLTVVFHSGSDVVQLGEHNFDCDNDLEEDKQQISVFSLPDVLNHSDTFFRPIGRAEILQETLTSKNMVSSPHELSLQLLTVDGRDKHDERSHSEPMKLEVGEKVETNTKITDEGPEPSQVFNIIEQQQQFSCDELMYDQFRALRERFHEFLYALMGRDSFAGESAATVQRETDQLFEQLDGWLHAMAEGERSRTELRGRVETIQREKDQLREQLALVELEMFRTEPRQTACEQWATLSGQKIGRSTSDEQLSHGGGPPLSERQLRRWKQIADTTFREVNHLRKRLTSAEADRLLLRNRLAILRGELAMEKCQKRRSWEGDSHAKWSKRRGSVDRLFGLNAHGETLASYNRWLGGDRWQSVPKLDDNDEEGSVAAGHQQRQKTVTRRRRDSGGKETAIVHEALRRQLVEAKSLELNKVKTEHELLRQENMMYEQKCDDIDRERQQMYLIMFRKGQQAANMELGGDEVIVDTASELQVVLRFLHDAFFYYLLNKGSAREHMQAIMTMLNFTAEQKEQVSRRRGKSRPQHKKRTTLLPDLTVVFHSGSDVVQLGEHNFDCDNDLEEDKQQISVFSLPDVLNHSDTFFRPIGRAEILQETLTSKNMVSSPHELSLQLLTVDGRDKHDERSHSEPMKLEVGEKVETNTKITDEGPEPSQVFNIIEQQQQFSCDELMYDQFRALRERFHEFLYALMGRDSFAGESAATVQRETDQLFEQLDGWLHAMAEGERSRTELRGRVETIQREKDQLREQLALVELEMFRTEPRQTACEQWATLSGQKIGRSTSDEQLSHGGGPPLSERQLRRWKQIADTTFREVNHLRKRLTSAEADRLLLRNRLAILRGELAMEKCQKRRSWEGDSHAKWSKRRGSVDRLFGLNAHGETLASYNRWLGGDRWQSVPKLDDNDEEGSVAAGHQQRQKTVTRRRRDSGGKETAIVHEALRRQLVDMRKRIELIEQRREEEVEAKSLELNKVKTEHELLRQENMMYEQKCDDIDRERQQMYLIMFRKGQQAANMELGGDEVIVDTASELQVVLRFLHDAFFYYLLNKGSAREHMQAIMTMLNFTAEQKEQVSRRRGKSRPQHKKRTTLLPDLTVVFHSGSDVVQLGEHNFDCDNDLEEDKQQISVFSLPDVLNHSDTFFRPIGRAEILQETLTSKNMVSSPHELSLQLLTVDGRDKHDERSHSEPMKLEVGEKVETNTKITDEGPEPSQVFNIIEQQQQFSCDELMYDQFRALRERFHEFLYALMGRDSFAGESAATVQRETDQLFEQLDGWLHAMAEGERSRTELRGRVETIQREKDQLREQLALVELEMFRTEPRQTACEQWATLSGQKIGRSTSDEQLSHGGGPPLSERQLRRWKQIADTTFREVNHLRKRLTSAEADRLLLRNRLAILRGELAMEKCQKRRSWEGDSHAKWSKRRGSVDRLFGLNAHGETLASYNRWLGGDRWQSVPKLDDNDEEGSVAAGHQQRQKTVTRRRRDSGGKETAIVHEALRRQLVDMRKRIELIEQRREEEVEAKSLELNKVKTEHELLRQENMMYEQKCDDIDRERQQMYLIMFRKGQQAANMELGGDEVIVDTASELQVVLRFLHDAFFYYLLNKGSAREHMQAIMTMLNFTAEQKEQVSRRRGKSY
uniref:GRIP domain-containing protein n=1 Tax=Globodera rostochiensis TaxID=31243 RepID=A0A914GY71_GLORO